MAITDYDQLVASIKRYCARSDSTFLAEIPQFVAFAEARLYNGHGDTGHQLYSPPLRAKVMEATGTVTVTDGVGQIPSDYLAMRSISKSGITTGLTYMPPERFSVSINGVTSGEPVWYTIEGDTIKVCPVWSGDLSILYWKKHPDITSSNKTGPLIADHGLAYLEASLVEAFSFLQAGDLALGHVAKLNGMIDGINRSSNDLRFSGPLRVRTRVTIG